MRSSIFIVPLSMASVGGSQIQPLTPPHSLQKHFILRYRHSKIGINGSHMSVRTPLLNLETTPLPTSQYLNARGTMALLNIVHHTKLASIIAFHFTLSLKKSETASP